MTVANKINEVIKRVSSIDKDGTNKYQNYSYTSADRFLAEIRKPMSDVGLICLPSHVATDIQDGVYILSYEFTLMDIDEPDSFITMTWMHSIPIQAKGKGNTFYIDDKALGKSQTYAHRYFLMKLFFITDQTLKLDAHDSTTRYAINDDVQEQKTALWNALKADNEIKARYTHQKHLSATIKLYDGDVVADGYQAVKTWLLNRDSTTNAD